MGTAIATRTNGNGGALAQTGGYEREQIDLIKQTVAVGATDTELKLFLYTCQTRGLDPLLKQAYFIKRGGKGTIQVGIDGFRMKAAETGEYAGNDDAEFTGGTEKQPESARVTVYRLVQGIRCPFTATARWDEYVQKFNGQVQGLWASMPHTMLAKCAESLALRKAFPAQLSGLYSPEEMAQAENRTVNTTTGEVLERTPVQPYTEARRNSDPIPYVPEPSGLDVPLADKRPDGSRQSTADQAVARGHITAPMLDAKTEEARICRYGLISHKGWMTKHAADPGDRELAISLLNQLDSRDGGENPYWNSRKDLTAADWLRIGKAEVAVSTEQVKRWVNDYEMSQEAGSEEGDPFADAPLLDVPATTTATAPGFGDA